MTPPDRLDALALCVADAEPIDWDGLLEARELTAEIDALRLIEAIAAAHRADTDPRPRRRR